MMTLFPFQKAKAVGWGATHYQGKPVSTLHEVTVPIMTNAMCRNTVYGRRITKNMLCAGYVNGGKDACQGDSGGPLMVANNSIHSLAGERSAISISKQKQIIFLHFWIQVSYRGVQAALQGVNQVYTLVSLNSLVGLKRTLTMAATVKNEFCSWMDYIINTIKHKFM